MEQKISKTRLPLDFENMKKNKLKPGVVYALRTYSFYDTKKSERKILKADVTGRKLEKLLKDGNRNHVTKAVTQLKRDNILVESGKFYIIKDIPKEVSSLELPTEFVKELLQKKNSEYIMIYLWLLRRYNMKRNNNQIPLFSIGDILRHVFGFENNRNASTYKRVKTTLAEIISDGLLEMCRVKVGRTYLNEILYVGDRFICREIIQSAIDKQPGMDNDYADSDKLDYDNLTTEQVGPPIVSPTVLLFKFRGSNKEYTFEETKQLLEGKSQEWVEENFYKEGNNKELIYTSGLDEEFPQYFNF